MPEWLGAASFRTALSVGIAVAFGLAVGILLVPFGPRPGDEAAPLPKTTLLGRELAPNDDANKVALGRLRSYLGAKFELVLPGGGRREIYLGEVGAELDKLHLSQLTRQARDRTSPLIRGFLASGKPGPLALPVPVGLDRDTALTALRGLKDELDRVPVDARLDLEKRTVVKETVGRLLDLDASLLAIETALEQGSRASSARSSSVTCSVTSRRATTVPKSTKPAPTTFDWQPRKSTATYSCPARSSTSIRSSARATKRAGTRSRP
jgi:hypothetical protein